MPAGPDRLRQAKGKRDRQRGTPCEGCRTHCDGGAYDRGLGCEVQGGTVEHRVNQTRHHFEERFHRLVCERIAAQTLVVSDMLLKLLDAGVQVLGSLHVAGEYLGLEVTLQAGGLPREHAVLPPLPHEGAGLRNLQWSPGKAVSCPRGSRTDPHVFAR